MTLRLLSPLRLTSSFRRYATQPPLKPKQPHLPSSTSWGPKVANERPLKNTYGSFHIVLGIIQLYLILHLETTYGIEISQCAGPSMVPTLSAKGDWIAINKWYRRGRDIQVGDLVDFVHPLIPGVGAVKRIVGMPGDFVVSNYTPQGVEDHDRVKIVLRDGEGIVIKVGGDQQRMIQVPEGHCWLLGDNLAESRDSRTYGPLPLALIKGKVIARVLPWRNSGWLQNNLEKTEDYE